MTIAICGAGPVGAACALFLRERGVPATSIALVDARSREAAEADDRMIAISHGSATLLARLGAWRDGADPQATAIHTVHVSQRGRFGRTLLDRRDYGVPALGYVVRHGDLSRALGAALTKGGIEVRRPVRVAAVALEADGRTLTVAFDGEPSSPSSARVVIHAEGGLFDGQQRRAIHRDYQQSALTAFVTASAPHAGDEAATAFERFTPDGPIALLPAVEGMRPGYSLVWCGRPDDAAARLALPDDQFLDALHAAFGDRLGRFGTVGARRIFPLGLNAVSEPGRARSDHTAEFAIGNAAQTLHPVAGQGLNLGLRDAFVLARLLAEAGPDGAFDARRLVARHAADRRADRAATIRLTDWMPRIFAEPPGVVSWGRGVTLALLDAAPPLRGVFARQMMNGQRPGRPG